MALNDLIRKNRSYRRFFQDQQISMELLREFVDNARLTPSAANRQPLRYFLCNDMYTNNQVFETLQWAGYLKTWPGPDAGERPSAYIVILLDKEIAEQAGVDSGIAAQTIMLSAIEKGIGGCMIASINRPELAQRLKLDEKYQILLVLALGFPKETVVIEEMAPSGDVKYWRDDNKVHHVPKRKLDEIIIK